MKDEAGNSATERSRVALLHIIDTSRLIDVLREDNRAIIRAASAASKAADYLLAFRSDGTHALCKEAESVRPLQE